MNPLWSIENLNLISGRSARLRDVSLKISAGVTAVLGWSGAGKSSLLNVLVGFEKPTSGTVRFSSPESESGPDVFWVPQNGGLWNHLTVREHIDAVATAASEILDAVELTHRERAFPADLSQGERARLAVARGLAARPTVLVLDEPLAHVDGARRIDYFDHVMALVQRHGGSLVFATHQPELVLRFAQRVVCLDGGRSEFCGPVTDLYARPKSERLASLLGPGNWFSPDKSEQWLDHQLVEARVVRPEHLRVVNEPESGVIVVSTRRVGCGMIETILSARDSGEQRPFVHTDCGPLEAGATVRLEVQ